MILIWSHYLRPMSISWSLIIYQIQVMSSGMIQFCANASPNPNLYIIFIHISSIFNIFRHYLQIIIHVTFQMKQNHKKSLNMSYSWFIYIILLSCMKSTKYPIKPLKNPQNVPLPISRKKSLIINSWYVECICILFDLFVSLYFNIIECDISHIMALVFSQLFDSYEYNHIFTNIDFFCFIHGVKSFIE